jgi:hypothetical protein
MKLGLSTPLKEIIMKPIIKEDNCSGKYYKETK